ncbi:MAG: NfeD family protein [Arachnia sp.]
MGEGGFWGWVSQNAWLAWGGLALALAAAELLTLDLTLLMLATGAAAGALTSLVAPGLWGLQIVMALSVAVATLFLLRPTLLERIRKAPGYRSSLESLVGSSGIATSEINGADGEVKVEGQLWEARTFDPNLRILEGQAVDIYGIDGVTLIVYPAARQLGGR